MVSRSRPIAASIRSNSRPASPTAGCRPRNPRRSACRRSSSARTPDRPPGRPAAPRARRRAAGRWSRASPGTGRAGPGRVSSGGCGGGGRPAAAASAGIRRAASRAAPRRRACRRPLRSTMQRACRVRRRQCLASPLHRAAMESGPGGLVNLKISVYLPDVGCLRRHESQAAPTERVNDRTRVDALRRGDRRRRARPASPPRSASSSSPTKPGASSASASSKRARRSAPTSCPARSIDPAGARRAAARLARAGQPAHRCRSPRTSIGC